MDEDDEADSHPPLDGGQRAARDVCRARRVEIGWRAYRTGNMREAAETFERGSHVSSCRQPSPWLYWSARARDLLNESTLAVERYAIVIADYGNSYTGGWPPLPSEAVVRCRRRSCR
jgi:hypothetical protein